MIRTLPPPLPHFERFLHDRGGDAWDDPRTPATCNGRRVLRARPRSPRFAPGSADERLENENADL